VWHLPGEKRDSGVFHFEFEAETADAREIQFKYYFPREDEGRRWEPDKWTRRFSTRNGGEVWTFDYSPRCMTVEPYPDVSIDTVNIYLLTHHRFVNGELYVWQPQPHRQYGIGATRRDEALFTSQFVVQLEPWMKQGFHFKFVDSEDQYEPDIANKVWRPGDGTEVWTKSGQVDLRPGPLELATVPIKLFHPRSPQPPDLVYGDSVDDFTGVEQPASTEDLDQDYRISHYDISVYKSAMYSLRASAESLSCERHLRIEYDESPGVRAVILGDGRWFEDGIQRSVKTAFLIHPNPHSAYDGDITLRVGVGDAEFHVETVADRQADRTWLADFNAFPDVSHWAEIVLSGMCESRPDGDFSRRRIFSVPNVTTITLHTVDGIGGTCQSGGPAFKDVPTAKRRDLMAAAYSRPMVDAHVFDAWEMPHGAVMMDDHAWFTLKSPYAVQAKLLILQDSPAAGLRQVKEYSMELTPDLRYWWCAVPCDEAPHGTLYRFQLNGDQEVIDPASRWVHDPDRLWVRNGEGQEGPWSKVLDLALVRALFSDSGWRTMGWEALLIYEMHPRRLTQRNAGASSVFEQLIAELGPRGYLKNLGVTALELLPVNEFPKRASWGYNPSLFFAVESSFGGPEQMARFVRASHDTGKAVLLDVVYNHANECPLQAIANDVYMDGETNWGAMINYSHPAAVEFFRQALLHMWYTFRLDGFRLDATKAIVDGHKPNDYILKQPNSDNRGWQFLDALYQAIHRAASSMGEPWPYIVAENDPNNWGMSRFDAHHVVDGQWHFDHHYRLGDAARNQDDRTGDIRGAMDYPHTELRPFYEALRFAESHDSTSAQEGWKQRIVRREAYGFGYQMAKAIGAAVLLAKGIPMVFMGQEAGEDRPFYFGIDDLSNPERYLRLDRYEQDHDMSHILAWFRDLMGLRNNSGNGFRGDDDQQVRAGHKTIAFTRGWGRFLVIVTLGTWDTTQNLGWLGLPSGAAFKEVFNSTWPAYRVRNESHITNGGYHARLYPHNNINLPMIGGVVLERG
jgi:1,4-alpha-glucan branching enzyme